ncbi:unnamed protein product, partial [Musa hybrid cultivar]
LKWHSLVNKHTPNCYHYRSKEKGEDCTAIVYYSPPPSDAHRTPRKEERLRWVPSDDAPRVERWKTRRREQRVELSKNRAIARRPDGADSVEKERRRVQRRKEAAPLHGCGGRQLHREPRPVDGPCAGDLLDQLAEVGGVGVDVGGERALRRPGLALLGDPPGGRVPAAGQIGGEGEEEGGGGEGDGVRGGDGRGGGGGGGGGVREQGDLEGFGEGVVLAGEGGLGDASVGSARPRIEAPAVLRHAPYRSRAFLLRGRSSKGVGATLE